MGLGALQVQDARDERRDESAQLTDSSSLAERRASPLELPKRSYTQATAPEVEGLPSTVMEMQEQRAREAMMKETAEQLVGAPVTPSVGPEAPPEEARAKRKRKGEVEEEAPEKDQAARARELSAAQAKELKRVSRLQQIRQTLAQEIQQRGIEEKRKALQKLWRFMNGLDTLTAEDIVGLILVLLMMNAQLLNQYSFKHKLIPKLSIPEVGIILCLDCASCLGTINIILPGCLVLLAIIAAVWGIVVLVT